MSLLSSADGFFGWILRLDSSALTLTSIMTLVLVELWLLGCLLTRKRCEVWWSASLLLRTMTMGMALTIIGLASSDRLVVERDGSVADVVYWLLVAVVCCDCRRLMIIADTSKLSSSCQWGVPPTHTWSNGWTGVIWVNREETIEDNKRVTIWTSYSKNLVPLPVVSVW